MRLTAPVVCFAVALAPTWWRVARLWPRPAAVEVMDLVPVVAIALAVALLRREPRGPMIHDRQMDCILALAAAAAAIELLHLAHRVGTGSLLMAGAACLMATALITAGWGTRALWQVRWAIALLLLMWRAPWAVAADLVWPEARSLALSVGDLLPNVAALHSGQLSVSSGGRSIALDPAAGGSVLILVFAGMLVGLAYAPLRSSLKRSATSVLIFTGAGAALAAVTWVAAVLATLIAGEAGAHSWASGQLLAVIAIVGTVAPLVASHRSSWPRLQGSRRPSSTLRTRLSRAVPRLTVSTTLIAVCCAAFVALQAGSPPRPSVPAAPAAGGQQTGDKGGTR